MISFAAVKFIAICHLLRDVIISDGSSLLPFG